MDLIILGASGSIGSQVLSILNNYEKEWTLVGFSIGERAFLIDDILKKFKNVKYICLKNKDDFKKYKRIYPYIKFYYGDKGLIKLVNSNKKCAILNALTSYIGLRPSIETLKNKRILLLANKESLVIGGSLLQKLIKKHYGKIIPIDSEHCAIEKCFKFIKNGKQIDYIAITASGGPFFNYPMEQLKKVNVYEALNHPNWKMGKKISIDSATMMNKVFEVIEAYYLFNLPYEKIKVFIDRTSNTHGFIKLIDNQYIVNNSKPTMINPIKYALSLNSLESDDVYIEDSLKKFNLLSFDYKKYFMMKYAKLVIEKKGNSGAILCSINDTLVNSFINKRITFVELLQNIDRIMNSVKISKLDNYFVLMLTIKVIRLKVLKYLKRSR